VDLPRRQFLRLAASAAVLPAVSHLAWAQAWPAKPIRAVVPFTAGSATDIIARTVFELLPERLGQAIIVENRTGAGGTIGATIVAKADPDGYTILVNSSSHTVTPSLYPNTPYDTVRDFSGVIPLGSLSNVLVVSPSKRYENLHELVAVARAKPGAITYASAGVGSATHFSAERLRLSADFEGVHVPFRGATEAQTEVMTGRIDFYCAALTSALPLIRDGKLLPLAVSTPQRAAALPNVPTTLEAGFANSDYTFWVAVFVPAKTPGAIVETLRRQTSKILQLANVREKLATLGVDPMPMNPAEFDMRLNAEIAANAAVIKAANITAASIRAEQR
jgi:tripartite-type tricarboxylate transporter receptor subunit TctC